jgi:hypothetical protein
MQPSTEQAAVLAANAAFYRAFAERDLEAMDRLWARAAEVACIHPGWSPCLGREAVMASWTGILGNPEAPGIRCLKARASVYGTIGVVVCYEAIERNYLIATNLFIAEAGAWKLVHHQAGALAPAPPEPPEPGTPVSGRLH